MKITIKDIAKMANVSITTVSLVLNDKPSRISKAKKEEIKKLAKQYHYQANMSAKNLVSRKSKTIGLLIPDIENFFFASLAKHVEDELRKSGFSMILVNSDDLYENDIALISNLINRGVDGLIVTISNESYSQADNMKKFLKNIETPLVMVDRVFEDLEVSKVYFDNQLGGYEATQHAIRQGHKNIAIITTKKESLNGYYRYKGYLKALKENNISINPNYIFEGTYRFESGYELTSKIIEDKDITAIICSNDLVAYGVIQAAKEHHINPPEDLLVIGYDALKYSKMLGLSFPTIKQDVEPLSKHAVKILLNQINGDKDIIDIKLKPEFKE